MVYHAFTLVNHTIEQAATTFSSENISSKSETSVSECEPFVVSKFIYPCVTTRNENTFLQDSKNIFVEPRINVFSVLRTL